MICIATASPVTSLTIPVMVIVSPVVYAVLSVFTTIPEDCPNAGSPAGSGQYDRS